MNILVVEDEFEVRSGIVEFLRNAGEPFMLFEAESAHKGLRVMEQFPVNIVLTDIRMPEVDGLELLELIKKHYPSAEVLIMSGYSDFSYAQRAMSFGVTDFLLKPVGSDQLLQAMRKTVARIQNENSKRFYSQVNEKLAMQNVIRDIIGMQPVDYVHYDIQVRLERSGFYMLHLTAELQEGRPADKIFWYSVQNICEETLAPLALPSLFFVTMAQGMVVVVPCAGEAGVEPARLDELLASVREHAGNLLKSELSVWRSSYYPTLYRLADAYRDFLEKGVEDSAPAHPGGTRHALIIVAAFRARRYDEGFRLLDKLLLDRSGLTNEQAKEIAHDIVLQLGGDTSNTTTRMKMLRQFQQWAGQAATRGALVEAVRRILADLRPALEKQADRTKHYAVQKAIQYMESHYADNVTLKDVADLIFMNESYLSSLFKSETGETFSDYLLRLRMSKAKQLLVEDQWPIQQVASALGYPNYGYFSQVFRKYFGVSPREFRKMAGHVRGGDSR